MKKIGNALLVFFSLGVLLSLLAGALSLLGYLTAIVIGGPVATTICTFIYKEYFPWVIRFCSVFVGAGLIGMYLSNMKALSMKKQNNDQDNDSP